MTRIIERASTVRTGPRVLQLRGIFDVPPRDEERVRWEVNCDVSGFDWTIGAIVGPSGSGKSTVARELFGAGVTEPFAWPQDRSVVDAFPDGMSIKRITALLGAVGFASPPAWLRPFHVLSTGEQFRVTVARALALEMPLLVIDEFTSVVDRQVARIASACIAKITRRDQASGRRLIVVTCHYDVIDWLQPDWLYEPSTDVLTRRSLQPRPRIAIDLAPVDYAAWRLFAPFHYMSASLHRSARCFVGFLDERPAAFCAMLPMPGGTVRNSYRMTRLVTLPDYQGLGLGPTIGRIIASAYRAYAARVFLTTSHPVLIHRLAGDVEWRMTRPVGLGVAEHGSPSRTGLARTRAVDRMTGSFEFIGGAMAIEDAAGLLAGSSLARSTTDNTSATARGSSAEAHRAKRTRRSRHHAT